MNGALDVGERIRAGVEKLRLPTSTMNGQIRLSIGITMIKPDDSLAEAFKRADQALYQAKQEGKNRIEVA
ncbi:MAG: GGDEF domain-containing protein [Gammaproteobacteria bacterium]